MILHEFSCPNCENVYEIYLSIKEDVKFNCPNCNLPTNNIPSVPFHTSIKNISNLGSLAEKNSKSLGKYGIEDRIRAIKEENKERMKFKGKIPQGGTFIERPDSRPFWRKDIPNADLNLLKMNKEQTTRYLQDGTRPIGV